MLFKAKEKWLIICEGNVDKTFFCAFLEERGISGFEVIFPKDIVNKITGGIDCFNRALQAAVTQQNLEAILLIADNDEDPDGNFKRVQNEIIKAGMTSPNQPQEFVSQGNGLKLSVLMIPNTGERGCLETLCLNAAYEKWPMLESPLKTYLDSSPANDWPTSPQSKMLIHCLIASVCQKDPTANLYIFGRTEHTQLRFSLSHNSADPVYQFLSTFSEGSVNN